MRFFITKTLFYLKKCYLFKIMLEPFLSYHRKLVIAEEKVKFLENSDVVFNTVIQLLKKNGIHVWLDFGTLLGAYRDSDFIKNDFDMDFGAFGTDYDKIKTLISKLNNGQELFNFPTTVFYDYDGVYIYYKGD